MRICIEILVFIALACIFVLLGKSYKDMRTAAEEGLTREALCIKREGVFIAATNGDVCISRHSVITELTAR